MADLSMVFHAIKAQVLQKMTGVTPYENAMMAYQHKTPYWIPNVFTDFWVVQPAMGGERYVGTKSGTDWFGVEWTYVPEMKAPMPTPGKILFEDIEDWKDYVKFPDLDAIDWEKQAADDFRIDIATTLTAGEKVYLKDGKTIVDPKKMGYAMIINGPFERMHAMMGFENALIALATNPEACEEFISAMTDHKIKFFQKIGKYYGVKIINAHDDYGAMDRMMMSPELWRKIIKPHLKRTVEAVHEMGLIYQHHSCGYIEPIIPDLVEIGVDAIDPLQAGNKNLRALKDKYQTKLTFVGGIDNQGVLEQPDTTLEEKKKACTDAVDLLAPGGSFISYPSVADFDLLPLMLGEYFRYDVPFYKKNKMGPWAKK